MNKIILTMILIILILSGIIIGGNIFQKKQYASKDNFVQDNIALGYSKSNEEIYDDCTDEWEGMNEEIENEVLQVNSNYEKEDQEKYKLKELDGVIAIYKIKENGEEVALYEFNNKEGKLVIKIV